MGTAHDPRVRTALTLSLRTFDRLDCAANAKISLIRCSLYIRYQWWSSCSDLTNTVRSRSQERRRGSAATHICSAVPRPLVFRTMGRRHRKLSSCYTLGRLYWTTKIMQLLYSAPAPQVRAHLMPHVTILNSHFWGGAKLRLE